MARLVMSDGLKRVLVCPGMAMNITHVAGNTSLVRMLFAVLHYRNSDLLIILHPSQVES